MPGIRNPTGSRLGRLCDRGKKRETSDGRIVIQHFMGDEKQAQGEKFGGERKPGNEAKR